jgi:hypothetical protein
MAFTKDNAPGGSAARLSLGTPGCWLTGGTQDTNYLGCLLANAIICVLILLGAMFPVLVSASEEENTD